MWVVRLELPRTFDGRRRVLRRVVSDYPGTHNSALAELAHVRKLMAMAGSDLVLADEIAAVLMTCKRGKPLPDERQLRRQLHSGVPNASAITVGNYLTWWVQHRQIDEHTRIGYSSHVRNHLEPGIGQIPLTLLHATHIEAMFGRIRASNAEILAAKSSPLAAVRDSVRNVRPTMPATMTRVRATLRKALNDAADKYRLIDFNPALHVEMEAYDRPVVRVWTGAAVGQWRATGYRPSPVMVWTPEQSGQFLDYAQAHDPWLYALYLIVILAGPRRGEAAGIRTDEVDFRDGTLTFSHQIATEGYKPVYKPVKTRSGDRVVYIDHRTVTDLERYWELRQQTAEEAGDEWPESVDVAVPVPGGYITQSIDLFFRQPDGKAWHPGAITHRFAVATAAAGLPPIRFHDGRHAAATYMKAAGGDLLDMKKKLGHASITVTADTYPAGLEEIDRTLAERTAELIPRLRPTTSAPSNNRLECGKAPAKANAKRRPPQNGVPEKYRNAPSPTDSSRAVNQAKHQPDGTKTQGAQRNAQVPPAVFLAPTPVPASGPDVRWPRSRRNRYPRDLK